MKPENILLDGTGHIKITDFGFAKKMLDRYVGVYDRECMREALGLWLGLGLGLVLSMLVW